MAKESVRERKKKIESPDIRVFYREIWDTFNQKP